MHEVCVEIELYEYNHYLNLHIILYVYRYIDHYSQWLPPQQYYLTEVKLSLAQLIGAGGPTAIQTITDEKLNMKIDLCHQLLKLLSIIAAGTPNHCIKLMEIHYRIFIIYLFIYSFS